MDWKLGARLHSDKKYLHGQLLGVPISHYSVGCCSSPSLLPWQAFLPLAGYQVSRTMLRSQTAVSKGQAFKVGHTKISSNCSSGISVSFEPWTFGTTSCTHGGHQLNRAYIIREAFKKRARTAWPWLSG